jgi:DNA-binding GntR family transcriptional regulator
LDEVSENETISLDRDRQAAPQIYEALRKRIVSLRLPPGTVLSRTSLIEQFGVSQTPIRDALLRLSGEKLVDIFPQHATVVSSIDVAQARQAHYLRLAVELEVVRQLCEAEDRSLIVPLRRYLQRQRALIDVGDMDAYRGLDLSFHRHLCEVAGVSDLWAIIRSRSGHLDRLRLLYLPEPEDGFADHSAILTAIESGDVVAAQQLTRTHLSRTILLVEEIRARFPQYLK